MNTIEFRVVEVTEIDQTLPVVVVLIDGTELTDLVARVEEPLAVAEGSPSLVGHYRGLWTKYVAPPSRHFLGEPTHPVYQCGEKTQILECECGEPGCWPLLCRIESKDERIIWSQFEQPHRLGQDGKPPWNYSGLGPFEFHRSAYERELTKLAAG